MRAHFSQCIKQKVDKFPSTVLSNKVKNHEQTLRFNAVFLTYGLLTHMTCSQKLKESFLDRYIVQKIVNIFQSRFCHLLIAYVWNFGI